MDRKRTEATALPLVELLEKIDEVAASAVRSLAIGIVRAGALRPDQKAAFAPEWWDVVTAVAASQEAERPDWTAIEHMNHAMKLLDATRAHVALRLALLEDER